MLTGQSGSPAHGAVRAWIAVCGVALLGGCTAPDPPDPPEPAPWTVSVLAQGSPLHATNGMYFGPDGRLYVVSASSAVVAAFDPESGELLEQWGPGMGVQGPDDITFGPDGSAYWTEFAFGDVGKRTPDGTMSVIASPGLGVNPITFSDDGRLFVALCALGDGLFEIDPDGVEEARLISDGLGPGCGLNGMDWGPDDRLYAPRLTARKVARVDVDSGAFETVATGFEAPVALKFDSQHRLHVLDSSTGEVFRVDIATGRRSSSGRPRRAPTTWPSTRTTGCSCRTTPTASSSRSSDPRRTGRSSRASSASRAAWPGCREPMGRADCFWPTAGRCGSWILIRARSCTS